MLVALGEDAKVVDKRLKTEHHPLHPCWQQSWGWRWWWCWRPGRPRLEEPDQLVQIMTRDLLRLVKKENWARNYSDLWSLGDSRARTCVGIPSHKCLQRSPILTRAHGKVGVGVWPERKCFSSITVTKHWPWSNTIQLTTLPLLGAKIRCLWSIDNIFAHLFAP